ncbi:MAG: septum formation protein Maf [Calditrichaeota bacterium]|nr:septum formation protein Maf [Calditrichota bacterium]
MPEIVLASTSPRRRMLLEQIGVPFRVIAPGGHEAIPTHGNFADIVEANALAKARSVLDRAGGQLVLGADTLVDLDGEPLGKPADLNDARRMLLRLVDREHRVWTGVALIESKSGRIQQGHRMTRIWFRNSTRDEIEDYLTTGEPLDKAGAYGIQGRGALLIDRIEGCFFNVMGLPLTLVWEMLLGRA